MRKRHYLPFLFYFLSTLIGSKPWKHPCLTEEFQLNRKGKPLFFSPFEFNLLCGRCPRAVNEGGREESFKFFGLFGFNV